MLISGLPAVEDRRTHSNAVTWPYDKYPDLPQLFAGSTVTILEAEGPGVVTNLHVSDYVPLEILYHDGRKADPRAAACLRLQVWYNGEKNAAVDMPLYDFLGDIGGESGYYATEYFSKVKKSHNLRLPMPFSKSIRMTVTNPTDTDLLGYMDVQWDALPEMPENWGELYAQRTGGTSILPETILTAAEIPGRGKIVAHWFQVSADVPEAASGEYICEGNQEFYLNGEEKASVEYLGTEDCYGYSWGFASLQSDGRAAIIRKETLEHGGARVAMLRCRDEDAISFQKGCVLKVDYSRDFYAAGTSNPWHATPEFSVRHRFSFPAEWLACTYWYGMKEGK